MSERPVDELEQLKSAFDELDSAYVDLLGQNERYREALEFYAARYNYKLEHFDPNLNDYMSTIDYDEGEKARKALEE